MAEVAQAQSTESALVVEDDYAQKMQARFTRFQMAIGLKERMAGEDLDKLAYGTKLKAIEYTKPTGFDMKDDVTIISLDTKPTFEGDVLVSFGWSGCSFDASDFKGVSPQDYQKKLKGSRPFGNTYMDGTKPGCRQVSEDFLTSVRHAIQDILHSLCEHHSDGSSHRNIYDHTGHKACRSWKKTILLVPDKTKCQRDFEIIGLDLSQQLHVIDIIDLRQLFQVWLVRTDYGSRSPMTGTDRTTLNHHLRDLSLRSQILSSLSYDADVVHPSTTRLGCLVTLQAAVAMAKRDAGSSRWLHTREQVDGGAYPGPGLELDDRADVECFLIEYDVSRSNYYSETENDTQTEVLKHALCSLSKSVYDAMILQLARVHDFTYLLDKFPNEADLPAPTTTADSTTSEPAHIILTQTPADTHSAQSSNDSTKTSAQSVAPSKSAETTSASTSIESRPSDCSIDATESNIPTPAAKVAPDVPTEDTASAPLEASSNRALQDVVSQYHQYQRALEMQLYACRTSMPVGRDLFKSFFNWDVVDGLKRKKATPITCKNYPRVFEIIRRTPGYKIDLEMVETLKSNISKREEAQKFYQRMPIDDPRRGEDDGHQNMIDVLKAGEAMLLSKMT